MPEEKKKKKKLSKVIAAAPLLLPLFVLIIIFVIIVVAVTAMSAFQMQNIEKNKKKNMDMETTMFDYTLTITPNNKTKDDLFDGTVRFEASGDDITINTADDINGNETQLTFYLNEKGNGGDAVDTKELTKNGKEGWNGKKWKIAIYLYKQCKRAGFSDAAAAAAVGNAACESGGLNTEAISNDGHNSYGLFQWTGGRKKNLQRFAKKEGMKSSNYKVQTKFFLKEDFPAQWMNPSPAYPDDKTSREAFMSMKDLDKAVDAFAKHYERMGKQYEKPYNGYKSRHNYAKRVYKYLNGLDGQGELQSKGEIKKTGKGYHLTLAGTYDGGYYASNATGVSSGGLQDVADFAEDKARHHNYPYSSGGWNEFGKGPIQCHAFTALCFKHCGYNDVYKKIWKSSFWKRPTVVLKDYLISREHLPKAEMLPGDIVCRPQSKGGYHSAIYIGNGKVAQQGSRGTTIGKYSSSFCYIFRVNGSAKVTGSTLGTIAEGYAEKGYRYKLGGWTLKKGVDCAHFCGICAKKAGIVDDEMKAKFANCGTIRDSYSTKIVYDFSKDKIKESNLRSGDILLFGKGNNRLLAHAAIYIGNGKIAHAMNQEHGVTTWNLNLNEKTGKVYSGKLLKYVVRFGGGDTTGTFSDIAIEQDLTKEEYTKLFKHHKLNKLTLEGVGYYGPDAYEYAINGEGTGTWQNPLKNAGYIVTAYWSQVRHDDYGSRHHEGCDLAIGEGTPIYAAAAGKVEAINLGGYGNSVLINHGKLMCPDGKKHTVRSLYGHMVSSPLVKKGDSVSAGQKLGGVGNTGHSFGNHLHFEVRIINRFDTSSDYTIDPAYFIDIYKGHKKSNAGPRGVSGMYKKKALWTREK